MSDKDSELVYSTTQGDMRQKSPGGKKRSPTSTPPPGIKNDGVVRVQRETKGRRGKAVTAIYGLPMQAAELAECARGIKQHCGTGGSVKGGIVIIQGDKCEQVLTFLAQKGHKAKKAGG